MHHKVMRCATTVSKDRVLWNIYIKLCILFSRRVYKVLLRLLGSEKNALVSELVKAVAKGNDNMLLGKRKFEDIHFNSDWKYHAHSFHANDPHPVNIGKGGLIMYTAVLKVDLINNFKQKPMYDIK